MPLVFHRGLAIPLWAIAFLAVALAAPARPMPPVTVLLGIGLLALTMMATVQWRRPARAVVGVRPVMAWDRAHAGIIRTAVTAGTQVRTVDRGTSVPAPDDALDLVRMDDDGGWQMVREPALPRAVIPGAREPGMLTTFGPYASSARIPDEPSTMDAATITQRQREGGAPSQPRPASERSPWNRGNTLHQFFMTTRALFPWRFSSDMARGAAGNGGSL